MRRRTTKDPAQPQRSASSVLTHVATVVGVLSGVVGLVFLLRPDLAPEPPARERSATLALLDVQPQLTRRQYLQRVDLSPAGSGLTPAQLDERGAFVEYRYNLVGYKGKRLPVKHELFDAATADEVSEAEEFSIEPLAAEDTGEWHAFVPVPRRGRFFVRLQLSEPNGIVPLDRRRTQTFSARR